VAIRGRDTVTVSPRTLPGNQVSVADREVPIQSYNLTVDLTAFEPGEYVIEVRAALRGIIAAGRRSLRIVASNERVEQIIPEPAPFGASEDQYVNGLIAVGRKVKPAGAPIMVGSYDELNAMIADSVGLILPKPFSGLFDQVNARVTLSVLNPTTERLYVSVRIYWPTQTFADISCWVVRRIDGRWIAESVLSGQVPVGLGSAGNANPAIDCRSRSER
jgi:hypothetical protein